jgi:hypothetical protein
MARAEKMLRGKALLINQNFKCWKLAIKLQNSYMQQGPIIMDDVIIF